MLTITLGSNSDWPVIIQAASAVLSLFVGAAAVYAAIQVPKKQRDNELHDRRIDERRKARALAFVLRPSIETWIDLIRDKSRMLVGLPDEGRWDLGLVIAASLHGPSVVPEVIRQRVEDLHLLGEAGDSIFNAIVLAHEVRKLSSLVEARGGVDLLTSDDLRFMGQSSLQKFQQMEEFLVDAIDQIVARIDDERGYR